MLIVVSPAKSLDFDLPAKTKKFSDPQFLSESRKLVKKLKQFSPEDLSELMNISSKLGKLNHSRYANWKAPFNLDNAKQAIFAFKGDVYIGLDVEQFSAADLNFAQKHFRMLSGLYGILRPLDLMQPYRLEMGTRLSNERGNNLYEFWGSRLTRHLNGEMASQKHKLLINLASNEYFSSIRPKELEAEIVTPVFKDYKNGKYKIISFFAKKARGSMSAYIIKNRIVSPSKLKGFDVDGYRYSEADSTPARPVFLRRQS